MSSYKVSVVAHVQHYQRIAAGVGAATVARDTTLRQYVGG
jgi:hypothetical protein